MQLYRTVCNTDWKCRPHHLLTYLGNGTKDELIEKMDADIREWMAQEIASDQIEGGEEASEEVLIARLLTDPELEAKWCHEGRYEMRLNDPDTYHREFVEKMDGDRSTTVYHFLTVPDGHCN